MFISLFNKLGLGLGFFLKEISSKVWFGVITSDDWKKYYQKLVETDIDLPNIVVILARLC